MDQDGISNGYAFDTRNIWTPQDFQIKPDSESLFQLPTLDGLGLDHPSNDFQGVIQIPELSQNDDAAEAELEAVDSDVATFSAASRNLESRAEDTSADAWTLDLGLGKDDSVKQLYTWEAFEKSDVPNAESAAYLSEAGPLVFDAVLASTQTEGARNGVLPQDVMLQALFNLALGRSSVFFQWDGSKQSFRETLEDVPISGYSLASHHSFVTKMNDCGSRYRALSEYVAAITSSKRSCTASVALKGCVKSLLDSIDRHIVERKPHIRSLLQLQRSVEAPHRLLMVLRDLIDSAKELLSDEAVISAVSDRVSELVGSESIFAEVLREILARVSTPWLERLTTDLGLRRAGVDQPFVDLSVEEAFDLDTSSSEQAANIRKLPEFINTKDRELIGQTKKSVRLLQEYLPLHQHDTELSLGIPDNMLRTPGLATGLQDTLLHSANFSSGNATWDSSGDLWTSSTALFSTSHSGLDENLAWAAEDTQQNYLATLGAHMSEPLAPVDSDLLSRTASSIFESSQSRSTATSKTLSAEFDFSPLDRLRPIIQAHSANVNKTLLRHLFWHHRLRDHLDLQRQFCLLGNGDFVSRLTKALFSTETQSAERRRGRIPTAETMGLRLNTSTGQRWPPASSEVQLTLMGILAETCHPNQPRQDGILTTKELPGGLSFSIRELPENEIEKVMDSGSIYALDFLKLQYTPSSPLDAIFTSSSLQGYDSVFRLLLKFLRVLHVTTKLREGAGLRKEGQNTTSSSVSDGLFANEAHQCITVLMSNFMEMGIAATWNSFLSSVRTIEDALKSDIDSSNNGVHGLVSLDELRVMHETCLERIRSRLFLRRKQQKLRDAIERILTAVLTCASRLESEDSAENQADFKAFQDAVKGLLSLLRAAVDKPLKSSKADEIVEEDAEAMRVLLLRLNWNGFYGRAE